jgi:hypothetical protein
VSKGRRAGRRSSRPRRGADKGSARGRRLRGGKGVLSAVRLGVSALGLTALVAVGVNLSLTDTGELDALGNPSESVWTGERVRVEVYNAGGINGMAGAATERLRDVGFDVVTFGNADPFDPERPSVVVDRVGRTDVARAVAAALRIDNVQSDPDPNLFVEVTVVVGRDWVGPEGLDAGEPGVDDGAWWDPRSWF